MGWRGGRILGKCGGGATAEGAVDGLGNAEASMVGDDVAAVVVFWDEETMVAKAGVFHPFIEHAAIRWWHPQNWCSGRDR